MNDKWLPAALVAALIGLMFYALIHSQPPEPHSTSAAQTTEQKSTASNQPDGEWLRSISIGDLATLAVAGATFFLVWVTRGSVRVAERALTELERPFIIPTGWQSSFEADRAMRHRVYLRLELRNYGRTPAIFSYGCMICELLDRIPKPMELERAVFKIESTIIAPGEYYRQEITPPAGITFKESPWGVVTSNIMNMTPQIPEGKRLFFRYAFRYNDILGNDHIVSRCWEYGAASIFVLVDAPEHNQTT